MIHLQRQRLPNIRGAKKLANQNSIHCKSLLKWNPTRVDPQQITHIQFSQWIMIIIHIVKGKHNYRYEISILKRANHQNTRSYDHNTYHSRSKVMIIIPIRRRHRARLRSSRNRSKTAVEPAPAGDLSLDRDRVRGGDHAWWFKRWYWAPLDDEDENDENDDRSLYPNPIAEQCYRR